MMKRKMTSAFAVAAMMGVATAFAVNPFPMFRPIVGLTKL